MPENNRKMQTDISELENGQLAEQQLPSDFTLVVLAGGASSHMGREKSDLLLDGQTFLEIQIGKGCQLGAKQILISGYRGTQCGEEIVPDRFPVRVHLAVWRAVFEGQRQKNAWCWG